MQGGIGSALGSTWRSIIDFLLSPVIDRSNKAEFILCHKGISDVVTVICDKPRAHVSSIWRESAKRA